MANEMDKKIESLLKIVNKQREEVSEMEAIVKRSWETNGSYRFEGSVPTNIQVATVATIHAVMTDLVLRNNAAAEAAEILGIEVEKQEFGGFTYDQWVTDLKKRVAKIQLDAKKKKLDEAEKRLGQLISPEKRREMELADLEKELGL